MSVYDEYESYGEVATTLGVTITKAIGTDALSVAITVQNDGYIDYNFGLGFSLLDAAGQVWDLWNDGTNHIALQNPSANGITPTGTLIKLTGQVTKTITVTVPVGMSSGAVSMKAAVYKESTAPPAPSAPISTNPASGWSPVDSNGNFLQVVGIPHALVKTFVIS